MRCWWSGALGTVFPAAAASASAEAPPLGAGAMAAPLQVAPDSRWPRVSTACLSASRVTSGFDQAFFDASAADGRTTSCVLEGKVTCLQRTGSSSRWRSTYPAPRGTLEGIGPGALSADQSELRHAFERNTVESSQKPEQQVRARRLGDCCCQDFDPSIASHRRLCLRVVRLWK